MSKIEWKPPIWMKVQQGEPITRAEWAFYYLIWPIWKPLKRLLTHRPSRAIRERCIQYAGQYLANQNSAQSLIWEARRLAEYIDMGEGP